MRNSFLTVLLCLFVFAKCKKDKLEPEGQYFGYGKGTLNGNSVTFNKARGILVNNSPDSLSISIERWDGLVLKEAIDFGTMLSQIGISQKLYKFNYGIQKLSSKYNTLRDDGDVLCDVYNIYESDSLQNYITITSYNLQTKEIRGTFQATYLIDSSRVASIGKCRSNAPDTIRIRNGEFYTKIF